MTTNITPDKAQELLRGDFASDAHQTNVGNLEAGTIITGAYIFGTPGDFALTEAAPALAELVASMHYEYAAQVEKNGRKYIITDSDEGHWLCGDDHKVLQDWHKDYMEAEDYAYSWNRHEGKRDGTTAHVIRRLVGEPEVAE